MQMSTRIAMLLPREDRKALRNLQLELKRKPRKKERKANRDS